MFCILVGTTLNFQALSALANMLGVKIRNILKYLICPITDFCNNCGLFLQVVCFEAVRK